MEFRAVTLPGVSNAWTMPIRARIDMLSTGIRTPVGIKIMGPDLAVIQAPCAEDVAKTVGELVRVARQVWGAEAD